MSDYSKLIYVMQTVRNGSTRSGSPLWRAECVETYLHTAEGMQEAIEGTLELWFEEDAPCGFLIVDVEGRALASMMADTQDRGLARVTYADGACEAYSVEPPIPGRECDGCRWTRLLNLFGCT